MCIKGSSVRIRILRQVTLVQFTNMANILKRCHFVIMTFEWLHKVFVKVQIDKVGSYLPSTNLINITN